MTNEEKIKEYKTFDYHLDDNEELRLSLGQLRKIIIKLETRIDQLEEWCATLNEEKIVLIEALRPWYNRWYICYKRWRSK